MAQAKYLRAAVSSNGLPVLDRLLAGLTCCLTQCRLRYSDSQSTCTEPVLDVTEEGFGYVEVPLNETKTTNAPRAKRVNEVGLGDAQGLDGCDWASELSCCDFVAMRGYQQRSTAG